MANKARRGQPSKSTVRRDNIMPNILHPSLSRLRQNESGLAMVEFAVSLPFFLGLTIGGVEIANYASVVMQLNQIALHTADSAARIGTATANGPKMISEAQIKDVFEGSLREGDRINVRGTHAYVDPVDGTTSIRGNTRIILSSVEEVASFDASSPRYRIRWQRCGGSADNYTSNYGTVATATSVTGIGPVGRQVVPPPGGSIMFVELQYHFKPMLVNGFTRLTDRTIGQVASMVVRDRRDLNGPSGSVGIYNVENVTAATCS